jgi:transcriptional regulator with XRE-family HTH domain
VAAVTERVEGADAQAEVRGEFVRRPEAFTGFLGWSLRHAKYDIGGPGSTARTIGVSFGGVDDDGYASKLIDPASRHRLSEVVGRNMRRERERRGVTMADVAGAAAAVGIVWDQSAVSRIERAERTLDFEEFAAIAIIMSAACSDPITYGDLFAASDDVWEEEMVVAELAPLLAEMGRAVAPLPWEEQQRDFAVDALRRAVREMQLLKQPADEEASSFEELRGFADRLDKPIRMVMGTIHDLVEAGEWTYHSPRAEREHRLVESGEDLSQSGRIRVLRGHITRKMEREIDTKVKEHDGDDHEAAGRPIPGEVAHP